MSTYQIVSERKQPSYPIKSPADAYRALFRYRNKPVEHFFLISLSTAHEVIAVRIISIGTLDRAIIHPRDLFIEAIKDRSAAIIVAHLHPSGKTEPSEPDLELTRRLRQAGDLLGIPVLDHLVISRQGYWSMVEHGQLAPVCLE